MFILRDICIMRLLCWFSLFVLFRYVWLIELGIRGILVAMHGRRKIVGRRLCWGIHHPVREGRLLKNFKSMRNRIPILPERFSIILKILNYKWWYLSSIKFKTCLFIFWKCHIKMSLSAWWIQDISCLVAKLSPGLMIYWR